MAEVWGRERKGGQGLDAQQEESGNRAILALLQDPEVRDHVDLVITCRDDVYEVWARRGMVRFRRLVGEGRPEFDVVETLGLNPIADQGTTAVATRSEESAASCNDHGDPNCAFIEPDQLSYPFAYERIAQLFDSPNAPDIVISPKCYAFGLQPGQHGALDVVQSRAPLAFAGPGIMPGTYESAPRHIDIAPTVCHRMGFPRIDGADWSGRSSAERGVAADVYLQRQDGRVLGEIMQPDAAPAARAYLVVYDGLSNSELRHLLATEDPIVRHLRRLLDRAAFFPNGSTVNFPSITWPSHSTILTGAWCGHHDIVNPAYYDRARGESLAPQAQGTQTESFLGAGVETLYEAFHRVHGAGVVTASIHEPQGRGARHAALEKRVLGDRGRLKNLTDERAADIHPRYQAEGQHAVWREAILDARGLAQIEVLFDSAELPTPLFVAHEFALTDGAGHAYGPHGDGLRTAIEETDARLGRVLDLLEAKGLFESTLFVFTSDHGMAPQDTSLAANPARHPERIGMKAITAEPMIWLRDMAVAVEAAADGRTARVIVTDNDRRPDDDEAAVVGADVMVVVHPTAEATIPGGQPAARLTTNASGVAGFSTPADVSPERISISIRHPDFNPRHVRLDGTSLAIDLRRALYR